MCGRFYINGESSREGQFGAHSLSLNLTNNLDIRPTNSITTIVMEAGRPQVIACDWGIKPVWSKKLLINAQVETAAEKPTWRAAFQSRRCLIPFDGWYEWQQVGKAKVQYQFSHQQQELMYMAALRFPASLPTANDMLVSLTVYPNDLCRVYHHRQPLIIPSDSVETWLQGESQNIASLLHPLPAKTFNVVPFHN